MPDAAQATVQVDGSGGWEFVGNAAVDEVWAALLKQLAPSSLFFRYANDQRFPTLPTPMARQLWKALHPGEPEPWHDGIRGDLPRLYLTLAELEQFPWDPEHAPQLAGCVLPWMRELAQKWGADHVRLVIAFEPEKETHAD